MSSPEVPNQKTESIERGKNVCVRSRYFRHAQKASGKVGDVAGFSSSGLSSGGFEESQALGKHLRELDGTERPDAYKIYGSAEEGLERTFQTGRATLEGYRDPEDAEPVQELTPRGRQVLWPYKHEAHEALYIRKWEANKEEFFERWKNKHRAVIEERGIDPDTLTFDELEPSEQAEIAEAAEEPVISEWLDDPKSEQAQIHPPVQEAARVAVLVRRDVNMPKKLNSGSRVDLDKFTHKTATEPLLIRILRLPSGKKPNKLSDIGGSLGLNDGFEFDIQTDEKGERTVTFTMYRVDRSGDEPRYVTQEYDVDLEELERLADLGLEMRKEEDKKN